MRCYNKECTIKRVSAECDLSIDGMCGEVVHAAMVVVIASNSEDSERLIKSMKLRELYGKDYVFTASDKMHFCGRHGASFILTKKAKELSNYQTLREAAIECACNCDSVVVEEV